MNTPHIYVVQFPKHNIIQIGLIHVLGIVNKYRVVSDLRL